MNNEISLKHEESRYLRNDQIELEKEIMMLKDEVKKANSHNSSLRVNIIFFKIERKGQHKERNFTVKKTYNSIKGESEQTGIFIKLILLK
jgi:hypothetical protein